MSPAHGSFSEDELVERPAIELFHELGSEAKDCFHEIFGPGATLGRDAPSEVVLVSRLRPALERLNPGLPPQAFDVAVVELT